MNDGYFHYTTVDVLVSILQHKQIWLTDYHFMNDPEELIFLRRVISNCLRGIDLNRYVEQLREKECSQNTITSFKASVQTFSEGLMGLHFERPAGTIITVFCVSEHRDSLPQWRAYGNQEVCIKFSKSFFDRVVAANGFGHGAKFGRVNYHEPEQTNSGYEQLIREMLDNVIKTLSMSTKTVPTLQLCLPNDLGPIFHKNIAFEAEGEWRLTVNCFDPFVAGENGEYSLRSRSGYLVPYSKVGLNLHEDIQEVMFGPDSDPKLVSYLAALFKQGGSWRVERSKIPYRA